MPQSSPASRQHGFTLIELVVATFVLLVGMLGVVTMLQRSSSTTALNRERTRATNLARELVEASRAADYDKLNGTSLAGVLSANPQLVPVKAWAATATGATAKVQRGPTTFTVTISACTFDDPKDQLATAAPPDACSPAPATAPAKPDQNGDDYRRMTIRLDWTGPGARPKSLTQTALVVNPTGGLGPRITKFAQSPSVKTLVLETEAQFAVETTTAATLHWNADDGVSNADAGPNAGDTSGTKWLIRWALGKPDLAVGAKPASGEVLDGVYVVSAQAFDVRNVAGEAKVQTVTLNRRQAYTPLIAAGGIDTRTGAGWVDFEWARNNERDIVGYRVYHDPDGVPGNGDDKRVCPAPAAGTDAYLPATAIQCQAAPSAPTTAAAKYFLVAVDLDNGSSPKPRDGDPFKFTVNPATTQPGKPTLDPPSTVGGQPTLTWKAPATGTPAGYWIYRDDKDAAHRIALVDGTKTTWSDAPSDVAHTYWITAVNADRNESELEGPVTWSP